MLSTCSVIWWCLSCLPSPQRASLTDHDTHGPMYVMANTSNTHKRALFPALIEPMNEGCSGPWIAKWTDSFNCWTHLIGSQGEAITHDRLFITVLSPERSTAGFGRLVCKGRRGVSAMLAEFEEETGIQSAPQLNPSPWPQSGRGLRGDVEAEPAGLNPQQMKTDSSHHFNCV